jgi:hypothetical protein
MDRNTADLRQRNLTQSILQRSDALSAQEDIMSHDIDSGKLSWLASYVTGNAVCWAVSVSSQRH